MTYRQFITELAKTPRNWRCEGSAIRRGKEYDCPIAAVYQQVAGRPCDSFEAATSSVIRMRLGMARGVRSRIVRAADSMRCAPRTRADLLKACGLDGAADKGKVTERKPKREKK